MAYIISGDDQDNFLQGYSDHDTMHGLGGNDFLAGGDGNDTLVGGRGNDRLDGNAGNNMYVFERGDGIDTIMSHDFSNTKHNIIAFGDGIAPADVRLFRNADNLVLALPESGDLITVENFFSYQVSWPGLVRPWTIEQILFSTGESWSLNDITRMMLPPVFELGEGNDFFQGSHANGNGGDDELFSGVSAVLDGGSGNDRLHTGEGDDLLTGGSGNDLITARGGLNTIVFARGWGQDTVDLSGAQVGFTILQFNAILSSEISFARPQGQFGPGNDLVLNSKTSTDSITLPGYFANPDYYSGPAGEAVGLSFADGAMLSFHQINQALFMPAGQHLVGTAGDDRLAGGMEGDVLQGMGGFDLLEGNEGNDVLIGGDGHENMMGGPGSDTYMPGAGSAVIHIGEGRDLLVFGREAGAYRLLDMFTPGMLTIAVAADVEPGELRFQREYNEIRLSINNSPATIILHEMLLLDPVGGGKVQLAFADGTVWSAAMLRNKLFDGTAMGEFIEGTPWADVMRGNDGDDTLLGLGGDDAMQGGAGNDFLNGFEGNDTLSGGEGDDRLLGGEGNDILSGGRGQDELTGGGGNDTYRLGLLDGNDIIVLPNPAWGERPTQTLEFGGGISPADVLVRSMGLRELFLAVSYDRGAVRLVNFGLDDGPMGPEVLVKFSDGTVWNRDTLRALTLAGKEGDDVITGFDTDDTLFGYGGNDSLSGGRGNDTLDGGAGRDRLEGGEGGDTYVFRQGDGVDTWHENPTWGEHLSAIRFGAGIKESDVSFDWQNGELVMRYSATDRVMMGYIDPDRTGGQQHFSHFEFADGSIRKFEQLYFHAPELIKPVTAPSAVEGQQYMWGGLAESFTDRDRVDFALKFELAMKDGAPVPAWIRFDPNGALSGTPGNSDGGVLNFIVTAVDQQGNRVPAMFSLTVKEGNQAPTVAAAIADLAVFEGAAFTAALPGFADADNDALSVTLTMADGAALPGWMSIDKASGKLTGTPGFADSGAYALKATATDPAMLAVSSSFKVVVANVNRAPLVSAAGDDLSLAEGSTFSGAGPAFVDPDSEMLRYSVTLGDGGALPSWLQFDPATGRIFGTPGFTSSGTYALKSIATDGGQLSASSSFTVKVADTNRAPVVSLPLADQSATEGAAFSFVLPGATFADPDAADSGTVSVSGLPSWLAFSAASGTFSGTPAASEVGVIALGVRFTDRGGLFAQDSFNVTVAQAAPMTLTGSASADVLTGKSNADTLSGLGGDDVLDGGQGADRMLGGLGNDVYHVDNAADVVAENAAEGTDAVISTVSYTLPANVEKLSLAGTAALNAGGNALDNKLTGNSGANLLDGGAGYDSMAGGDGNDIYMVDSTYDTVIEASASGGFDQVISLVGRTLGLHQEMLTLGGTASINGTGNSGANLIQGNSGANILNGGDGSDILQGGAGNDTLSDSVGGNLFDGGAGADRLTGNTGADMFIGGAGNDTITTGTGVDVIAFNRGDGADTVALTSGSDNVVSLGQGIRYADLALGKSGNDLVFHVGAGESITFKGWYSSTNARSVGTLQVLTEGGDYVAGSASALTDHRVELFNFTALAGKFDQLRTATPSMSTWNMASSMGLFSTGGSDSAAIGGDLAYAYGVADSLAGLAAAPALAMIGSPTFGTSQALQGGSTINDGTPMLY